VVAEFLHAGTERVGQPPVQLGVVELATDADLVIASRPGLATPPPTTQFLDDR